ncbi:L-type lectin-domain containing receptor kinase IX.2-like [Pecten maximus]|uniref:L-type lectin-domain containing receptor kinase IX.2-like n=1 Tax=Pecten maximus TaxID=6579 RepID=UPI0014585334|nr:L-type lectin-domain containing receptor kinase IX.2-like [Pecten maximus]
MSVPGVIHKKAAAVSTVSTQDIGTQMSIPASILNDVHEGRPNEQVQRYQMDAMNHTPAYDYTVQRNEILQRHANLPLLNHQEFQFLNLLGKGAKGSVYLAMANNTVPTAVKVYHSEYSTKLQQDILNESGILSILQDTGFVPRVYGLLPDQSDVRKHMLVQEFYGNGRTLWSILNGRDPNVVINTEIKINIAYQLVFALKAIHDKDVLLNDIKSNNVLVDTSTPDFRIRYIDFDLATFRGSYQYSIQAGNAFAAIFGGQTFSWLAPEVRMGGQTTPQSDIYSVGYLISELQCPELQEMVFLCTQEKPYPQT